MAEYRFDTVSVFPEYFPGPLGCSLIGKAAVNGIVEFNHHNLRDWSKDPNRTVDDTPYGGGAGMLMEVEPFYDAVHSLRREGTVTVLFSPRGKLLNTALIDRLTHAHHFILLCPRYEGVDARVGEMVADHEISIGDYVLNGGEPAALVFIDAFVRTIPGVIGSADSLAEESFSNGLLEYPHYTRPAEFRGNAVPDILLSGNHEAIRLWRKKMALVDTFKRRPDLIEIEKLDRESLTILKKEGCI